MPENTGVKRIVIIDDEKSFVEIFSFALKSYGYEVIGYSDSAEALKNIQIDKPNLIILDLLMPKINGFDFIKHLRNVCYKENECKVIILTNLDETESGLKIDDNLIKSIGGDALIKKTSNLNEIIAKIKNLV
ncbi:MAG: response regulator [Patescibacteria group bacterium]|nr:response regulator [Patescibacteria group bacterium]MCX7589964.1 response regulator [Patescibacteria group bacterium]MDW8279681.1 response regulator [bacterium]